MHPHYSDDEVKRIVDRLDSSKEPLPSFWARAFTVLRWVGFLPAALLSYFVLDVLFAFLPNSAGFINSDNLPWCIPIFKGACVSMIAIFAGVKVAPSNHWGLVVVITIPLLTLAVLSGLGAWLRPRDEEDMRLWGAIGMCLGCLCALIQPTKIMETVHRP